MLRSEQNGWIYFVECDGRIKIGFAANPWKRFDTLKGASPHEMKFLGAMPGTCQQERDLHGRWTSQRVSPKKEWFNPSPELLEFISDHAEQPPPSEVIIQLSEAGYQ